MFPPFFGCSFQAFAIMVSRKVLTIPTLFSCIYEHKCKITNLGGKHILVGTPSSQGTRDNSAVLVVFVLFFGGSLHTRDRKVLNMYSWKNDAKMSKSILPHSHHCSNVLWVSLLTFVPMMPIFLTNRA